MFLKENVILGIRLSRVKGLVRRAVLNIFKKSYVEKQLRRRKGECKQCGKCCTLAFKCPFLTKSGKCFIYNICRPRQCKTFPLDKRDLEEIDGECGYYFL